MLGRAQIIGLKLESNYDVIRGISRRGNVKPKKRPSVPNQAEDGERPRPHQNFRGTETDTGNAVNLTVK